MTFVTEREKDSQKSGSARSKVTNQGHSAEYQIGLWDQLFLSGSLRYDDNERFKDTTTYRITAAHVLEGSGTRFHGSYGTGVKNPTLSHLFQQFGRVGPNPDVEPEESKGWDIGVEQNLLEDRLSLDITYFNNQPTKLVYWNDAGTPYDPQVPETGRDDFYDNLDGTSRQTTHPRPGTDRESEAGGRTQPVRPVHLHRRQGPDRQTAPAPSETPGQRQPRLQLPRRQGRRRPRESSTTTANNSTERRIP